MKRRSTLQVASTALAIGFGQACEPRTAVDQDADPDLTDAQARLVEESSVVLTDPNTGYLNGVNGATFLGDKIVVAEAGEHRIVAFSVDGELLWRAGRHGSGPGEFEDMSGIATIGDHVVVYDTDLARISEFNSSGVLVSTSGVDIVAAMAGTYSGSISGVFFSDGRVAVALNTFPWPVKSPRIKRFEVTYALFDHDGEFLRYLATVPLYEHYAAPYGRGGESIFPVPFTRHGGVGAVGNQLVSYNGRDPVLRYVDIDAGEETSWVPETPSKLQTVTDSFLEAARESATYRYAFEEMPGSLMPTHMPPYGWMGARAVEPLVTASDGSVWTALITAPGEGSLWRVVDDAPYVVASEKPRELLAIGEGFAVTKQYDDLNVETIEVLRIIGPIKPSDQKNNNG